VLLRWAVAGAVGAAVVIPLLALSVAQSAAVSWITRPGVGAVRTLFHDYFGATTAVAVLLFVFAVIAVLPGGRGAGAAQEAGQEPPPWWRSGGVSLPSVAAPLLVLPAFLLLAESVVGPPLYVDRYVLYGEAGAALLAGAGVYRAGQWLADRAGRRELLAVPGVVLCALALVLQLAPQHRIRTPQSRAYDFGGPSRYLAAHADSGDGVLFFGTLFRKAELGYPGDFTKVTDFGEAQSPTQAGTFRGTDKSFSQTYPLMLRYPRIWVIGLRPSPQLPAGLLRQESDALISHFSLVSTSHFKGMFVTLWQRR